MGRCAVAHRRPSHSWVAVTNETSVCKLLFDTALVDCVDTCVLWFDACCIRGAAIDAITASRCCRHRCASFGLRVAAVSGDTHQSLVNQDYDFRV